MSQGTIGTSILGGLWYLFNALVQLVKNLWTTFLFFLSVFIVLAFAIYLVDLQSGAIELHLDAYGDYVAFSYRHPLLAALSVLMMGFLWGMAGTGLGLPNLFWPDRWSSRMYAGIAITLYFALIGTLAHYETRLLAGDTQGVKALELGTYLFVIGIPIIILILVPAAVPRLFPRLPRRTGTLSAPSNSASAAFHTSSRRLQVWLAGFLPTLVGVLLGIVIVVDTIWISDTVTRFLPPSDLGSGSAPSLAQSLLFLLLSDSSTSHLIRFYIIFALVFFVGLAGLFYRAVTPAVAVCSLFSLASMSVMLPDFLLHINSFKTPESKQAFENACKFLIVLAFVVLPLLLLITQIFRSAWRLCFYRPITMVVEDDSLGRRFRRESIRVGIVLFSTIAMILIGANLSERWITWIQNHYFGLFYLLIWLFLGLWFVLANSHPFKLQFPNMRAYYPGGLLGTVNLRKYVRQLAETCAASASSSDHSSPDAPASRSLDDPLDNTDCLNNWFRHVRQCRHQRGEPIDGWKPKLAVVTVSGGALRSAYWTSVVLKRISEEIPDFGSHVRLIAGASGGMVGAAYFVSDLRATVDSSAKPMPPMPMASIDAVARYIALREVFKAFVPKFALDFYHSLTGRPPSDRGIRLEQDWKGIDVPLRDYRADEAAGKIPSLVLSPMIVESGRRLLISNLDMSMATCTRGSEITETDAYHEETYSISAIEFSRLFPEARDFHLSTAVRMSATFPFVSPAVNLPTSPPVRVVDAGYYDNYGVHCATSWLLDQVDWLAENTSGVVLIQIRDSLSHQDRLGVVEPPHGLGTKFARGVQMLTSPVHAVAKAREASTSFRNDHDVMNLSRAFAYRMIDRLGNPHEFFTSVTFENSASVSFRPRSPGQWPGDGLKSPRRERQCHRRVTQLVSQ